MEFGSPGLLLNFLISRRGHPDRECAEIRSNKGRCQYRTRAHSGRAWEPVSTRNRQQITVNPKLVAIDRPNGPARAHPPLPQGPTSWRWGVGGQRDGG